MFNFSKGTAGVKESKIVRWEVFWYTPFGISNNLEKALEKCISLDMDPDLMIVPVPAAILEDGSYEIWRR